MRVFFLEQYYKPSSVFDDHLSSPSVTTRLKRPTLKHDGQPYRLKFGLASSGVYMDPSCYQESGGLLNHLSTLTRKTWRYISVALALESPPPDVIRHSAL